MDEHKGDGCKRCGLPRRGTWSPSIWHDYFGEPVLDISDGNLDFMVGSKEECDDLIEVLKAHRDLLNDKRKAR